MDRRSRASTWASNPSPSGVDVAPSPRSSGTITGRAPAITAPRWLLGRTWGESSDTLKIESRHRAATTDTLKQYGHDVEIYPPYDDLMGHAGAILRHRNGMLEGGSDPRSDGGVARW